jgi:hypothetical protein
VNDSEQMSLLRYRYDESKRRSAIKPSTERHSSRMSASLANALRINENMVPQIHKIITASRQSAVVAAEVHAFVYPSHEVQASVSREPNGSVLLAISSSAVTMLSREELRFVIGHEMGHVAFDHIDMPVHLVPDEPNEDYLEMQRAAEISADRVGYLQVRSLDVAVSAMAKMASGLDARHLEFNPASFIRQVRDLKLHPAIGVAYSSHPPLPIRARALIGLEATEILERQGSQELQRLAELDVQIERDLLLASYGHGGPSSARDLGFWKTVKVFLQDGNLSKKEQDWVSDNFGATKLHSLKQLLGAQDQSEVLRGIEEKIEMHEGAMTNASPAARREYSRIIERLKRFHGQSTRNDHA